MASLLLVVRSTASSAAFVFPRPGSATQEAQALGGFSVPRSRASSRWSERLRRWPRPADQRAVPRSSSLRVDSPQCRPRALFRPLPARPLRESQTGRRARMVGRSQSPPFLRQEDDVQRSRVLERRGHVASRRLVSSTPPATRACTRGTGSSSQVSTRPKQRRRACSRPRAGSRERQPYDESFPRDQAVRTALSVQATFASDFVTT